MKANRTDSSPDTELVVRKLRNGELVLWKDMCWTYEPAAGWAGVFIVRCPGEGWTLREAWIGVAPGPTIAGPWTKLSAAIVAHRVFPKA